MADYENLSLGVMKDITLTVKKQDTGVRAALGLALRDIKVMKDITLTAALTDTSVRAGLGFLPKFLGVLTRIDGTSTLPFTRKVLGVVGSVMNPSHPGTYISGHITEDGLPSIKRLRLYDKDTGQLIAETFSAADGSYRFDEVSTDNKYYIVAFDEDGSPLKNAKVLDNIQK
jgi:hypothetical protein